MSNLRRTLIATTAGLVALGIATSVALAQGGMMGQGQGMGPGMMGPGMQQMPGQGVSPGMGPQMPGMQLMPGMSGQGMGSGMMGQGMPGMMGQGQGTGPGMMGPGMQQMPGMSGQGMGPGMMGPGMQQMPGMPGQGMGMMGQGTMGGQGPGMRVTPSQHLTTDDVSHFLGHFLQRHGNPRLKVGDVQEVDEDTILAEIVTVDDSLVQRWRVDRHTGQMVADSAEQAQPAN